MAALPEPLHSTVRALYRLHEERRADEKPRGYLGCSELGQSCARRLWYGWRWCGGEPFEGRMLRLFDSGNREEARLIEELRAIGVTVEGQQFAVAACDGHVRGHLDGALLGLQEAPKTWHVLEVKTHNVKSFAAVKSKSVRDAKPVHYAQLQLYMGLTDMERAAYFAVCKDTDEVYLERVHFDRDEFKRLLELASMIVNAPEPPPRLSEDPAWWECKYCPHRAQCHQPEPVAPAANCRTCVHSTPITDGEWECERHSRSLTLDEQVAGCEDHRFIPALVPWLTLLAVDGDAVTWKNTTNGAEVRQPQYLSREIHAATDKRFLGDPFVAAMKATFGDDSRVVSTTPETMRWQTFSNATRHIRIERDGLFVRFAAQTPELVAAMAAIGDPEYEGESGEAPQSDLEEIYEPTAVDPATRKPARHARSV